jgi:uncharacterized protein YgbK (DUF1537 family)
MPLQQPIIVIADDLSGAAELAGIAFARGLTAEVHRQFDPSSNAEVIAIDTDTRHLSPQDAAVRVSQVAREALAVKPAWVFKKVDSVLRGHVAVEILAILEISSHNNAVLIPANPSRGRSIRGGEYLIDGVPLDQTVFANDPEYPRLSANVRQLLGHSSLRIEVPDISTPDELDLQTRTIGLDTLSAGAADFFTSLLNHHRDSSSLLIQPESISLPLPALLICGSQAAWPQRQADCLAASLPIARLSDNLGDSPKSFQTMLLGLGDQPIYEGVAALSRLAKSASAITERAGVKTILAEGGATAAALSREMNWPRFTVERALPAGVGALKPHQNLAPLFLIKPGSYPWPQELWRSFCTPK